MARLRADVCYSRTDGGVQLPIQRQHRYLSGRDAHGRSRFSRCYDEDVCSASHLHCGTASRGLRKWQYMAGLSKMVPGLAWNRVLFHPFPPVQGEVTTTVSRYLFAGSERNFVK